MVRLWNSNRITKKKHLCGTRRKCENDWSSQLLELFSEFDLEWNFEYEIPVDIKLFNSWMTARTEKTKQDPQSTVCALLCAKMLLTV